MLDESQVTVTVEPITKDYFKTHISGQILETAGDDNTGIDRLNTASIFGREKKKDWKSTCLTENYRGYIALHKPILNYAIAGKKGIEIFRLLSIPRKLGSDIMAFNVAYNTEEDNFVEKTDIKALDRASGYLFGPEIVEHFIKNWDKQKAVVKEMYRILHENCFQAMKIPPEEIGIIDKTPEGIKLVAGYYFHDIATEFLKETVLYEDIQSIFLQAAVSPASILYVLLNTTRQRLMSCVMRRVIVLPIVFRADMQNQIHTMNKQYMAIRKANNTLYNYCINGVPDVTSYITAYEDLNSQVNYLLFEHDNMYARKSLSFTERLKGKKRFIRGKMISKRSDYTGRGVVVCNPALKLTEIAVPDRILAKVLYHHFIKAVKDPQILASYKTLTDRELVDKMVEYGILDNAVGIVNRAPTLHRLSMLAYNIKRAKSDAIEVNTLLNEGYNMDHDGDTAALKIGITTKAIAEISGLLHARHNLFKPSDGSCTLTPRQDMIYGLYKLTYNYPIESPIATISSATEIQEAVLKQKIKVWDTVIYAGETMTAGQAYFKSLLPKLVYKKGQVVTSKTISSIVEQLLKVIPNNDTFLEVLWELSITGFKIARLYPPKMTIITGMQTRDHFLRPFKRFYDKLHDLDEANSLGFCTEYDYNMEFDNELDILKKRVDDSIIEEIEGVNSNPRILMLNGLYMSTLDKYKLDKISDDEELTVINDEHELGDLLFNRLIPVNDTIIFKGKRQLAGRAIVEAVSGKAVTKEIDASNINSYYSDDVRILGLKLANLFSDIDIDEKILAYENKIDEDLNTLYELTKEQEVDIDSEDEAINQVKDLDDLENKLLSKKISPIDTIRLEADNVRYNAGCYYLSKKSGVNIIRPIDEYAASKYLTPKMRDIASKFKGVFPNTNKDLSKYVSEDFRKGSGTVHQQNGFVEVVVSGARGKTTNLVQIFGFKGQIAKADGNPFAAILEDSFVTQLSPLEHLTAAYGSRKGVIAKSIMPKDTGYLERLLWHSPEDIIITEEDCGTTEGLELSLNVLVEELKDIDSDMATRYADARKHMVDIITGRYLVGDDNILSREDAQNIVSKLKADTKIYMRSPIKCKNPCCAKCFGVDLTYRGKSVNGTPIGFIASESIGEPGTQLTLKAFQKGGLASRNDSDKSESQRLMSKFCLADITDVVKHPEYDPVAWASGKTEVKVLDNKFNYITIEGSTKKIKLYADVEVKEIVKKGEPMCKIPGDQDIKEKLRYAGVDAAQRLIILSAYFIFAHVASVNIKYFETVVAGLKAVVPLESIPDKDVKALQVYTTSEWRRKGVSEGSVDIKETLMGVKQMPKVRESCMCNFLMEDVSAGLRRALLVGNKDNLINPFNATVLGLHPMVGTRYNKNFIKDRLEAEKHRLDI